MELQGLVDEYADLITAIRDEHGWGNPFRTREAHGWEVAPGWFNLYSQYGQSKMAFLHESTNLVFKESYGDDTWKWTASGAYVGEVFITGTTYKIRIPEFHLFTGVTVQEYIGTNDHTCAGGWCSWAHKIVDAISYRDAHCGNWSLYNGEIVIFDFD